MRILVLLLAGCALVSKSQPIDVHYFSPELPAAKAPSNAASVPRGRLRLARVIASSHLRYRIVQRESAVELSLYDTRRWSEMPERYVRRSLERALFEVRGLDEATGGSAVALDVEVLAFEEVRGPTHRGRVQLRYRLRNERDVLASGVVTGEREVLAARFDAVVEAIGGALDDATSRVADAVLEHVPSTTQSSAGS